MALIKPLLGAAVSGKIGGFVFSHNAGGQYIRALSIPTNPNTPQQVAVRGAVSSLTSIWNNGLSAAQREVWNVYAANVKLTNRLGEQVNVSGMAMYVRSNVPRIQAGEARVDDGPGIFNLGEHSAPTVTTFSEATQSGDLNFFVTGIADQWAREVGGFMFLYLSRPQNASINYFRGPYRFLGVVTGDPVPPASPAVIVWNFPFIAGQKLFGRVRTCRADGRLSTESFMETTAIA